MVLTSKMQEDHQGLNKWQMTCQEGIEDENECHNRETKKRSMPSLKDVALTVQDNQTLDLSSSKERSYGTTALPSECTEPTNEV